jgi:glycosyltransferase involved in cell wall biosynthesis
MRIAYVCYWDLFAESGVTKKITTQVNFWRDERHEVRLFSLRRAASSSRSDTSTATTFSFSDFVSRVRATSRLAKDVRRFQPDVIYLRHDVFVPPLVSLLSRFPTVVEVNTDDVKELRLRRRRAATYNSLQRAAVLRRAAGLVCVTRELAESSSFKRFAKPTITIGNGIDLRTIDPAPPPSGDRPVVVFSGSASQAWNGTDKLVDLAGLLPDVEFHLVGIPSTELRQRVPENLEPHGPLAPEQYEQIYTRAHAAVGTLALHRKGLDEASPLKVREYLAYGLPTVIAYEDTDLDGDPPWFVLRIPNTERNVHEHADAIRAFLRSVGGKRVPREEIADRIDARAKESARLAFMERLIARTGPPGRG